jgi:hypothetical protein
VYRQFKNAQRNATDAHLRGSQGKYRYRRVVAIGHKKVEFVRRVIKRVEIALVLFIEMEEAFSWQRGGDGIPNRGDRLESSVTSE